MVIALNWNTHLLEFAQSMGGRKFRWGSTDCVTLTRKALKVIYERDPWRDVVPTYKTKTAAVKTAKTIDAVDALLSSGAVEVGAKYATAGDVALGPTRDAYGLPAVSIVIPGRAALVSTAENGVRVVDKLALPQRTRFFRYG